MELTNETLPPDSDRLIKMQRALAAEPELVATLEILATFNADERRAFHFLAEKHVVGCAKYGSLDIGSETRDFRFEGAKELADFLNYQSFWYLMRILADMNRRAA